MQRQSSTQTLGSELNFGKVVVFDLDQTLVSCNCSYSFCTYLREKKVLPNAAFLKAYWYRLRLDHSSLDLKKLHSEIFNCMLRGLSMDALENYAPPFLQESLIPSLYYPAFQELRLAQHAGAYSVIMSGSPSFLVQKIAEMIGVDAWLGTEYELDRCRRLSGVKRFVDGEVKAEALRRLTEKKGIPLEDVSVYSDSHHDLPVLSLAGRPVAVNPEPKLHELSMQKKWRIL